MFGYVVIDKPLMRIGDYNLFKSYYCGLCRELKKSGLPARLLLNYDCVFLYLLAVSLDDSEVMFKSGRCVASPFRKKAFALNAHAAYAAAVNVLLGVNSLKDKRADDKSLAAGAGALFTSRAYKKAKKKYPELAEGIEKSLKELAKLEAEGEKDIDAAAHVFAGLLGAVFSGLPEDKEVLYQFGYSLGRWIYLADAYEDFEKDQKKGSYNPFIKNFETAEQAFDSAEYNLLSSLRGAMLAYDLLSIKRNREILDNIMYDGLQKETRRVLERRKIDGSVSGVGRQPKRDR